MSREIKFRAWHKLMHKMFDLNDFGFSFHWEKAKMTEGMGIISANNDPDIEVMQYTGLKDKNGVDIYESDLLLDPSGEFEGLWLMKWMDAGFNGEEVESKDLYHACEFTDDFEVIGNIHQNPELMEKG